MTEATHLDRAHAAMEAGDEAARLRSEFGSLVRLEANYRRGGLSRWERDDLNRRFDRLAAQIRNERRDGDNRRG